MIVNQEYWDKVYDHFPVDYNEEKVLFKDLFDKYIKKQGGSCFEIGCYPGNYLLYLCKHFDYTANGIDKTFYIEKRLIEKLKSNAVEVGEIIQGDFTIWGSDKRYDLVCSFGFIEHFFEYEAIIKKQLSMVNNGGIAIISCPNFTSIQGILHYILDNENYKRHHIQAMNLKRWGKVSEEVGFLELYSGYYRTCQFWVETPPKGKLLKLITTALIKALRTMDNKIAFPNPFTSPYMIGIYQRKY